MDRLVMVIEKQVEDVEMRSDKNLNKLYMIDKNMLIVPEKKDLTLRSFKLLDAVYLTQDFKV